jgi:PiT family inorganic phosphate transporter
VSTTHVATGGIVGVGSGQGRLHRRVTGEILAAWVLTLPLAAALAAVIRWGLG